MARAGRDLERLVAVLEELLRPAGLVVSSPDHLRDTVLSRGRSQDPQTQFRNFYGRAPDIGPLIEYRGLAH